MNAPRCVFCRLLSGELEVSLVHPDALCCVVADIQPVNPGHVLVIPNRHAESLSDLRADEAAAIFATGIRMGAAIRASGVRCEGINFFLADGAAAGQEVFHAHLHVFPRYRGDGFKLSFGPHYRKAPRGELDALAGRLREALESQARGNG
jgi:histidine triad (HIT) family protein